MQRIALVPALSRTSLRVRITPRLAETQASLPQRKLPMKMIMMYQAFSVEKPYSAGLWRRARNAFMPPQAFGMPVTAI